MTSSQAEKSTDQSNLKPFLLVQYPSQGTPVFKFLNIKHPRFGNPAARSNGTREPVHISKVIYEVMAFVLGDESPVKRGCR